MSIFTVMVYVFLELTTGTIVGTFESIELCNAVRADVAKKVNVEPSICWRTSIQAPVRPPR